MPKCHLFPNILILCPSYQNLRPDIPRCCPNSLANIMKKCWDANPEKRPDMNEIVRMLEAIDTSKGGGMIPEGQSGGCLCFTRARGPWIPYSLVLVDEVVFQSFRMNKKSMQLYWKQIISTSFAIMDFVCASCYPSNLIAIRSIYTGSLNFCS